MSEFKRIQTFFFWVSPNIHINMTAQPAFQNVRLCFFLKNTLKQQLKMIIDNSYGRLDEIKTFAKENNLMVNFNNTFFRLESYSAKEYNISLYSDFAPPLAQICNLCLNSSIHALMHSHLNFCPFLSFPASLFSLPKQRGSAQSQLSEAKSREAGKPAARS